MPWDQMGPPTHEQAFQDYYAPLASKWGIDSNPDDPAHHYDYRAAFDAGASPDDSGHWPSQFKDAGHPRRFMRTREGNVVDTINGQPAPYGTQAGFDEDPMSSVSGPRVLTADEYLGPSQSSRWDELSRQASAQPQMRKRDRVMMHVKNVMGGLAHGAAAATGIPAWQRAAAQIDHDNEMQARTDAVEAKSQLSYLAQLAEKQQHEADERADYERHPMSEYNGQRMPLDSAMQMAEREGRAAIEGRRESRLENAATQAHQDRSLANQARIDAGKRAESEHAATAMERRLAQEEATKERHRHNLAMEGRQGGGGGAGPAGPTETSGRAALKYAMDAWYSDPASHSGTGDSTVWTQPTKEWLQAKADEYVQMLKQTRGIGGLAPSQATVPNNPDPYLYDEDDPDFDTDEFGSWLEGR